MRAMCRGASAGVRCRREAAAALPHKPARCRGHSLEVSDDAICFLTVAAQVRSRTRSFNFSKPRYNAIYAALTNYRPFRMLAL